MMMWEDLSEQSPMFRACEQGGPSMDCSMMWNSPYVLQGYHHDQGHHSTRGRMLPSNNRVIPQVNAAKASIEDQLKLAVLSENTETAVNLIRGGARTSMWVNGRPLLHHIVVEKQDDILQCCIENGAYLPVVNSEGTPLLHFAVVKSNFKAVEMLLDYFDINTPNNEGFTPLFYGVVASGTLEVFDLILRRGAAVNVRNKFGDTPLHLAASYTVCCPLKVKELLQQGADVHARNMNGYTALDVALRVSKRHCAPADIVPVVNALLAWGSIVDEENAMVVNFLASDIDCELETLRRVLEYTNGATCRDAEGLTPLHYAVQNSRIDLAELLLEEGAEIDALDNRGGSPLQFGVFHDCSPEMAMFLMKRGARISSLYSVDVDREDLACKVRAYFLDFKNDSFTLLNAFTSKSNCNMHYYTFVDLIKFLPAIDVLNFYLAFRDPL